MLRPWTVSTLLLLVAVGLCPAHASAQAVAPYAPDELTANDYRRAEAFFRPMSDPSLVTGGTIRPTWTGDDSFVYRVRTDRGWEFFAVDVDGRHKEHAFDHERVAQELTEGTGSLVSPFELPFSRFTRTDQGIRFVSNGTTWSCVLRDICLATDGNVPPSSVTSPDGHHAAYIQDLNLWVRDLTSGADRQLTFDGIEDFGYATNNAGWVRSDRPVLRWSPDSKKIATFQHDGRGVGEMALVSTEAGHPRIDVWKYPLPEDSVVFRIERVVIDVAAASVVRLDMPADVHRTTVCDHVSCGGTFADVEWSEDSEHLAFVSSSRDHKVATLRIADPATGAVRTVLTETVETFYESGYNQANWHVMYDAGEVLWYSRRDNWGHLYLYDLQTGELKKQITQGEWNVLQVRHQDADERTLLVTGAGREPGDPYFQYLYSVHIDDGHVRLLTPDSANHTVSVSPSGNWFVDSWSTPVTPPQNAVRDLRGRARIDLENSDITRLIASGWKAPIPFVTKARDGVTDLHGLMYTPTSLDPTQKYPVVNYLYPGPQSGSVGSRSFNPARRDHQAIAELGFIVVEVDAMGTPMRSREFHETYYGDMGDNGLPDQITTIEQLAAEHPWMDLDRVGIWGHSGGGFASTAGILRYPDFYKVAVSQAGNHDNRVYEDDWGEKWQGLLETNPDGTSNYDNQANQLLAEHLKGKLLLAHGSMDDNVPPANTMLVADALIAANKDFDLLMLPNRRHGFAYEPYMMRKRWDYFVKHLLGAEPPKEFTFGQQPVS